MPHPPAADRRALRFLQGSPSTLLLLLLLSSCTRNPTEPVPNDILGRLRALPGVSAIEIEALHGYPSAFQIDFRQPVDHNNLGGQRFTQRIYLHHIDESLPVVFSTNGYGTNSSYVAELGGILQANHISAVHRFFEDARPTPADYSKLTIWQSAADHHRIVQVFKRIYDGPWITTGGSKSGETALFHRRFYPDDVEVTVAYVAPLVMGAPDWHFPAFFDHVGTAESRSAIRAFQRRLLSDRETYVAMVVPWFDRNGYTFSGNPDGVFESRVASYEWNFWQYHRKEWTEIPSPADSDSLAFEHLAFVARLDRASDEGYTFFEPYYYQAQAELGYPATPVSHLSDLLHYEYNQGPDGGISYSPSTVLDVFSWLLQEGDNIIFIYGSIDPWSARAVEPIGVTNALFIMQEGGDHRVKIEDLDQEQTVLDSLGSWLEFEIGTGAGTRGISIPSWASDPERVLPPR
ncbi:S28 family serine protease [Candidatus Zixiibacteriota bacterium]